jgi:hypothetical protein
MAKNEELSPELLASLRDLSPDRLEELLSQLERKKAAAAGSTTDQNPKEEIVPTSDPCFWVRDPLEIGYDLCGASLWESDEESGLLKKTTTLLDVVAWQEIGENNPPAVFEAMSELESGDLFAYPTKRFKPRVEGVPQGPYHLLSVVCRSKEYQSGLIVIKAIHRGNTFKGSSVFKGLGLEETCSASPLIVSGQRELVRRSSEADSLVQPYGVKGQNEDSVQGYKISFSKLRKVLEQF